MGILTGWIVTVAGVTVLINVCEILMPEGEMNKYIKGILSIVCMFVLVSPLPKLFDRSIDFSELLSGGSAEVDLDYSFLDYVNQRKAESLAADWAEVVENAGLPSYAFAVQAQRDSEEFTVEAVVLCCEEKTEAYAARAIALLCEEYGLQEEIFIIRVNSTE